MLDYIKTHRKWIVYLPLGSYWLLLFVLTSLPSDDLPSVSLNDKVEHFLAFFGLGFLLNLTLFLQEKYSLTIVKAALYTFIFGALYGAADELHQLFIPGRVCDIIDWTADSIGILLGVIVINLIIKLLK